MANAQVAGVRTIFDDTIESFADALVGRITVFNTSGNRVGYASGGGVFNPASITLNGVYAGTVKTGDTMYYRDFWGTEKIFTYTGTGINQTQTGTGSGNTQTGTGSGNTQTGTGSGNTQTGTGIVPTGTGEVPKADDKPVSILDTKVNLFGLQLPAVPLAIGAGVVLIAIILGGKRGN